MFLTQMGPCRKAGKGLLRNFDVSPKSGMGVSPVSAWNRKDGRDAHPTLSLRSFFARRREIKASGSNLFLSTCKSEHLLTHLRLDSCSWH